MSINNGEIEYDDDHFESDGMLNEFSCAECCRVICNSKDETISYLIEIDKESTVIVEKMKKGEVIIKEEMVEPSL